MSWELEVPVTVYVIKTSLSEILSLSNRVNNNGDCLSFYNLVNNLMSNFHSQSKYIWKFKKDYNHSILCWRSSS